MNKELVNLSFIKTSMEHGADEDFLIGFLEKTSDIQREWMDLLDEIESKTGDKEYRFKLASEIFHLAAKSNLEKIGDFKEDIMPLLTNVGQYLGGENSGAGRGGAAVGGLGGSLGGLILSKLLGVHPLIGLLLGGILGGTGGYSFGSGKSLKDIFGLGGNTTPTTPPPGTQESPLGKPDPSQDVPPALPPTPERGSSVGKPNPSQNVVEPGNVAVVGDKQNSPPVVPPIPNPADSKIPSYQPETPMITR